MGYVKYPKPFGRHATVVQIVVLSSSSMIKYISADCERTLYVYSSLLLAKPPIFSFYPFSSGMGWAMVIVSGSCTIYYNIVITWTLYYLCKSMTSTLPWANCGNWWNTQSCSTADTNAFSTIANLTYNLANGTLLSVGRNTTDGAFVNSKPVTAAEEFWQ